MFPLRKAAESMPFLSLKPAFNKELTTPYLHSQPFQPIRSLHPSRPITALGGDVMLYLAEVVLMLPG